MSSTTVSTAATGLIVNGDSSDAGTKSSLSSSQSPAFLTLQNGQRVKLPSYDELLPVPGMPHGCTWKLWEQLLGLTEPDELGTLNLLTPATVLAAKQEIKHGISVAINWSLDNCQTPHSNRMAPVHKVMTLKEAQGQDCPWIGHDDEIHMNTQSGSQWDGLRTLRLRKVMR
jgi:hypothetical protein